MKQKAKLFIIAVGVAVISVIAYYVYSYVLVTTDYYCIKVEPATLSFVYNEPLKPHVDISMMGAYDSDAAAVNAKTKAVQKDEKMLSESLEMEINDLKGMDFRKSKDKERIASLIAMLNANYTVVSITHRRGYSPKDIITFLKKHNIKSADWKAFCDKNKLEARIYPIERDELLIQKTIFKLPVE